MSINNDNFSSTDGYDIDLRQEDVSGGKITIEQIDTIKQYPEAKSIIISGLEQKTFDYFINKYGKQFQAISFWKNKGVKDLFLLSELEQIESITYFYNQKATKLWNMSNNKTLKGLELDDFTKLHSVDEIKDAPALEVFNIGNAVSLFPENLVGTIVKPYYEGTVKDIDGNETAFYFLCKGKRKLTKGIDDEKFHKYLDEFNALLKSYRKI